jgi:para-aminobenzoate synthetase component I
LIRNKEKFSFLPQELDKIKRRMLHWANQSDILLFLDSNEYLHTTGSYECICAIGYQNLIKDEDAQLSKLKNHFAENRDWLFGHINYDFKNKLEQLNSRHPSKFEFPEISFFTPAIVCYIPREQDVLVIESLTKLPSDIWSEILNQHIENSEANNKSIAFEKRIGETEYIDIIRKLQSHILEGDCYEINFCNEAFCSDADINPVSTFKELNKLSKAPFAAYYKLQNQHLICASPERFLRKEGARIIAQPIKGTARRMIDSKQDNHQKKQLQQSIKERAENVMIVDLMRNDLARFCQLGSVKVDELFGLYSFPQVHQLISTISGQLRPEMTLFDALRLAFPMGSMTGAPKIMVMQLIEQYEQARRELFSGCVGYISPEGDFDFNVIIRSIFYNQTTKYLSYQTGGAITFDSIPQQEWEETCLKAEAIEKIFR